MLALPTCEPSAVQNEYTGQWLDVMKVRAINICVDKKRNIKIAKNLWQLQIAWRQCLCHL